MLKADITTTVDVLHDLFCEIWVSETLPADWRRGLIVKIAKKGDLTKCGNTSSTPLLPISLFLISCQVHNSFYLLNVPHAFGLLLLFLSCKLKL